MKYNLVSIVRLQKYKIKARLSYCLKAIEYFIIGSVYYTHLFHVSSVDTRQAVECFRERFIYIDCSLGKETTLNVYFIIFG